MTAPAPARAAQSLISRLGGVPPTDLAAAAAALDAAISSAYSAGDEAGFTSHRAARGNQRIVAFNTRLGRTRQRFALAHALGHLQLHRDRHLTVCKTLYRGARPDVAAQASPQQEEEANAFALTLLMPEAPARALVAELRELEPNRENLLRDVAAAFDVATAAASARLYELGILTS